MLRPRTPQVIAHWSLLVEDFNTSALAFYDAVESAIFRRDAPDTSFSRVLFKEGGFASADREYLRVERRGVAIDVCAAPFGRSFFFSSWTTLPGPKHPWLWMAGFIGAFLLWLYLLSNVGASALQRKLILGESGGWGVLFTLLLFGLPILLFALGLAIHEGRLNIEEADVLAIPVIGWLYFLLFNPTTYYRLDTATMFRTTVHNAVTEVIDGLRSEQGLRALSEVERKPTIREFFR